MKIKRHLSLGALLCLIFSFIIACQQPSTPVEVAVASFGNRTYPKLLDRPTAIQYGQEWDKMQSAYSQALKALNKNSNDHKAALQMVRVFIIEARVTGEHGHYYPSALNLLDSVLADKLMDRNIEFQAKSLKASVLLSQHEFKEALKIGLEAAQEYSYNAQIYGVLTDAYVELGDYEKAVTMADKMVSIRPDLRSYSRVSYLREIHGDIDGAIEAMKLAVAAGYPGYEDTAWARLTLGELYEQYGSLPEAEAQYKIALSEREDYPFAIAALAGIAEKKGDVQGAETLLKRACTIIPEVGFYEQLASIYSNTNRTEKATKLNKEVLSMLEDDVLHGHNMNLEYARFYMDNLGDLNKALEYALIEYEKRPNNIDVNTLLAVIYRKGSRMTEAKKHYTIASRTNSEDEELKLLSDYLAD